jgi:hypothetical protein
MGKNNTFSTKQDDMQPNERKIHPIWRGIGLILAIITPIMAYYGSLLLLEENGKHGWVPIPTELVAPGPDPYLYTKIVLTFVLIILIFAVFSMFYFILYGIVAPPRYGPYDVPPPKFRKRRR